jgi:hypothetical protein
MNDIENTIKNVSGLDIKSAKDKIDEKFKQIEEERKRYISFVPIVPVISGFVFLWIMIYLCIALLIESTYNPFKNQFLISLALLCVSFSIVIHGVFMGSIFSGIRNIKQSVFTSFIISAISVFITFVSLNIDILIGGNLIKMFENSIGYYIVRSWYLWSKNFDLNTIFKYHTDFCSANTNQDLSFLLTFFEIKDVTDFNLSKINNILKFKTGESDIFQCNADDASINFLKEMIIYKYRIGNYLWFFMTSVFEVLINLKYLLHV